eukprot:gb/GECG01013766.1/.p1 GENE.gb/GECG01013766.1/~~gb/GECG01013766.1/.p1  ORF type:complete len:860 (+),score=167.08 gb/GECG01013766.1/:1-2580(+)
MGNNNEPDEFEAGMGGLRPPALNEPPPLEIVQRERAREKTTSKRRQRRTSARQSRRRGYMDERQRQKNPYSDGPRPKSKSTRRKAGDQVGNQAHRRRAKLQPGSQQAITSPMKTNKMPKMHTKNRYESDEEREGASSPDEVPDYADEFGHSGTRRTERQRFPSTAKASRRKKTANTSAGTSDSEHVPVRTIQTADGHRGRRCEYSEPEDDRGAASSTRLSHQKTGATRGDSTKSDGVRRRVQTAEGYRRTSERSESDYTEPEEGFPQEQRDQTQSHRRHSDADGWVESRRSETPQRRVQTSQARTKSSQQSESVPNLPELNNHYESRGSGEKPNAWTDEWNKGEASRARGVSRQARSFSAQKSSGRRHSTGRKSSKPVVKKIAGYVPPTDSSVIRQEYLDEAKRIMQDEEELRQLLEDHIIQEAAEQLGIDLERMKPLEEHVFRNTPATPRETVQMRHHHYDNERERQLGLILSQRDSAYQENLELRKQKQRIQDAVKENLEYNIETEEKRLERARQKREKVRRVIREDNSRLRARKDEFARQQQELEEKRQREQREKEEEDRRHKQMLKEKEEERKMVKKRAEEKEAARLQAALDEIRRQQEKEREQEAERERQRQEEAKRKLEKKLEEERKRQEHEHNLLEKRNRMLEEYKEKERRIQQQKEEQARERQRRKEQRWMQMATKHEDAQRMMREKEHRKRIEFEKEHLADKRIDAIKQMKRAFAKERQEQVSAEQKKEDEWRRNVVIEKHMTPGPLDYRLKTLADELPGGRWGEGEVPRLTEQVEHEAKQKPGPGQHNQDERGVRPATHGGYISTHKGGGYADIASKNGTEKPGTMRTFFNFANAHVSPPSFGGECRSY